MTKTPGEWTVSEKRRLHEDDWSSIRLVEITGHDKYAPYAVIDLKQQGAAVVPVTPEGDTFLIRQFRYAVDGDVWEIVEGGTSADDDPLTTAKKELQEEMGISARKWTHLGEIYPAPARLGSLVHIFLAENLTLGTATPDANEHIAELRRLPLRDAYEMAMRGELTVGVTAVALARAWHMLSAR